MAENLSGVPPQVTLSGLDAGPGGGGFSGATQQGLGGAAGPTGAFGMMGGLDLAQLMQLIQAAQGAGTGGDVGVGGDMLAGLGAGAFGQQQGGLGAGSFGQTQPQPGYVAGQSATPGMEQAGAGSADPLAIVQKILGLAQKGTGLLPTVGTASPTVGDSGVSLSDQVRSGQVGIASPVAGGEFVPPPGYYGPTEEEMAAGATKPGLGMSTVEPTSATLPGTQSLAMTNQLLGPNAGLYNVLTGGAPFTSLTDYSPEAIQSFLQDIERTGGQLFPAGGLAQAGGTGISGVGGTGIASPVAGQEGSPGVNLGGVAGGGIGGILGLLNLYQALQGGNVQQGVGGGLQGIGGLATLLQSAPELASALGISQGALGAAGAGAGGLGGILGLAGGIQGLVEGQGGPGTALQLGGGALGVYNALQQLGLLGSGAGAGLGGALASYAPGVASGIAGTFGGASGAAGAGAAGASAGLAGLAGAAAPIIAALVSYFGAQEESAARRSGWWNNPIIGNLYERAVTGTQGTNTLADQIRKFGVQNVPTDSLLRALGQMQQGLFPYYERAQGGAGAVAGSQAAGAPGMLSKEAYGALGNQATQNVYEMVNELQRRGVTPQQLGAIPAGSSKWGETYLGGMPVQSALAPQLAATQAPEAGMLGNPGLAAIQSGSWLTPTNVNTVTGGPVLSMLSALNPELYGQIGGQMNFSDPAVQAEIARQQEYANMINAQAYQDFTSGGA